MNKAKVLALSLIIAIMTMYMPACAQEVEAGDFTGILTVANDQKIVVSNAQDTKEFATDDATVYNTNGESGFCMNDIVTVTYHGKGKKLVAEDMTLKKHVHEDSVFSGTVMGLEKNKTVTVTSKSLTIMFSYDKSTPVDGDLHKGDKVRVTYIGNLSEFPTAKKIVVTEEAKEEPETLKASGIISEFTDTSLQLSIDSAHSRKFTLDKNTKITGVATKLKAGDSVNVTFKNTEDPAPLAVEVNIVKEAAPTVKKINGTIASIGSSSVSLKTDEKTYTFTTDKNTKFKGVKPAVGCSAEITYTETDGKNLASVVYCQKAPEKGVTAKGTVVSWGNGNATINIDGTGKTKLTYTNKLEKASDYKPKAKDYVKITYMKSSKELTKIQLIKRPDPKPVKEEGTLTAWGIDGKNKCTIDTADGTLELKYDPDSLDIPVGYEPQADDSVSITYTTKDMVLRSIKLIERPDHTVTAEATLTAWGIDDENKCTVEIGDTEVTLTYDPDNLDITIGYMPQTDDYVDITYTSNDNVLQRIHLINRPDDSEDADGQDEGDDQDDGDDQTPADDQQPSDEQPPADEQRPSDDDQSSDDKTMSVTAEKEPVLIKAEKVTVVSVDGSTIKVELKNGDTEKLNYDSDTDFGSGYFPEEGDKVDIVYDKDEMLLKKVELKDKAAPADVDDDDDDDEGGDDDE